MLEVIHEPYNGPHSYPLTAALEANITTEQRNAGALDTNLPYGGSTSSTLIRGGVIMSLTNDSGTIALEVPASSPSSGDTYPLFICADDLSDYTKSGRLSVYPLCGNGKYDVKSCYDTGQTYVCGTLLTWISTAGATNQGWLTPVTNYAAQPHVAVVITPPSSASNDDPMEIFTCAVLPQV